MRKLALLALLSFIAWSPAPSARAEGLRDQAIAEAIAEAVVVRQHVSRKDVKVEWNDGRADNMVPVLPPGHVTYLVADNARLGGKGTVPVQIWVAGQKVRTIFPRVSVEVLRRVLVARAAIARGQVIAESDIGLERTAVVDSGSTYNAPLTSLKGVLGAEATRLIPEGSVLTAGMVRLPTLVKAGQVVSVLVHTGDVTIVGRGEARSSGGLGQTIRLVNLESKKEFTAKIMGPDRVEIEMED